MTKRVILARSPEGKVTTINALLGIKGVPYGWEYLYCDMADLDHPKFYTKSWERLRKTKRIFVSTSQSIRYVPPVILDHNDIITKKISSLRTSIQDELQALDIEYFKALSLPLDEQLVTIDAINRRKDDLRNLVVTPNEFDTDDEFIEYWPEEFDLTLNDYLYSNTTLDKKLAPLGIVLLAIFVCLPLGVILI